MSSRYTIELGEVIEDIWDKGHPDYEPLEETGWETALANIDEKIEYARPKIFSFVYSYYGTIDEKKALERDILSDYYLREINCDNFVKWQLMLRNRLHQIMPKYVAMYNAQVKLLAADFLKPYEIDEARKLKRDLLKDRQGSNTSSETTSTKGTSNTDASTQTNGTDNTDTTDVNKFSNTPQALMQTNKDYLTSLTKDEKSEDNTYSANTDSSNTSKTASSMTDNGSTVIKQTDSELTDEDYTKLVTGNLSKFNYGELTEAYNRAILNIEQMIVEDLNDLFYLVY